MAAVFRLSDRVDEVDGQLREVDDAAEGVFALLGGFPARLSVPRIQRYRDRLNALEVAALAKVIDDNGDTKIAEKIVGRSGKVSKRANKNAVARATLGKKNPVIAEKMAAGDLSDEQVDVIVDTDRKTGGAAGSDDGFINAIAKAGIDHSRGVAADFVTDHADSDGTQTEHDRQRLLRKATKFGTDRRTEAIILDGDKATINKLWSAANKRADELYHQDGGRDVPFGQHARTHQQRLFDAFIDIFTNGTGGRSTTDQDTDDATTPFDCDPSADAHPHVGSDATGSDKAPKQSKRYTPKVASTKPTIVVAVTLEKFIGLDPDAAAEVIGCGPIADSVLAEYMLDANIVGMLFGQQGQPLWMSRQIRLANMAQQLALVIRDKRCVLCGADHTRCKAHHTTPWNAPAKGETNITKLALVCDSCHHQIHDNHHTIYKDRADGRWKLRPALLHEIPPPRPLRPADGQGPQLT
jgi:hypothetical protein